MTLTLNLTLALALPLPLPLTGWKKTSWKCSSKPRVESALLSVSEKASKPPAWLGLGLGLG